MKTGYIRAAGYNIVNLVERGAKRLIVVVMGGRTAKARDAEVRRLLKPSLPRAASNCQVDLFNPATSANGLRRLRSSPGQLAQLG